LWRTPPTLSENHSAPGDYCSRRVDEEARTRLESMHAACRREVNHPDRLTMQTLQSYRALLDIEFARAAGVGPTQSDSRSRVALAVRWMEQHLDLANPIFLLCDYLQVSPSTLNRNFLEVIDESPSAHYHRLRMQRARALLKQSGLAIKEIAFQLGYKHPNDFSRAYKAYHGTSARRG